MKKRRGQSAAFMARIRKLRNIKPKRKVYKRAFPKLSMARKRRSRGYFRKAKRYGRRHRGSIAGISAIAVGVGSYILYKNYLANKIPIAGDALVIGEPVVGYMLAKKSGFVGDFGKALLWIGIYNAAVKYIAPHMGGMGSTTTTAYY